MSVTAVSILVDRHGTTPLLLAKKCSYILSYKQKECKRSPGVSISFSSSCKVAHFFFNCTCARFERPISTFGLLYTSSGTNWKVVQSTKPRSMRKHVATLMFTICIARTAGIPHATATRKMRSKCPSSTMVYGCKGTADDFLDRYAALPSAARNSAGVRPPSASLRLSVLYRPIQPPSSSMKRAGVQPDQSLPCQNSLLSRLFRAI